MKLHLDDAKLEKNPLDPCRSKGEKIILTRRQEIALLRSGDLRVVSLATYDSAAAPDSPPGLPTRAPPPLTLEGGIGWKEGINPIPSWTVTHVEYSPFVPNEA